VVVADALSGLKEKPLSSEESNDRSNGLIFRKRPRNVFVVGCHGVLFQAGEKR
jgi:hypothetical protein